MKRSSATIVFLIFTIGSSFLAFAQDKLTFEDVMKFEDITQSSISDQGNWLIYTVAPDRERCSCSGPISLRDIKI